jgi:hypothetical protein
MITVEISKADPEINESWRRLVAIKRPEPQPVSVAKVLSKEECKITAVCAYTACGKEFHPHPHGVYQRHKLGKPMVFYCSKSCAALQRVVDGTSTMHPRVEPATLTCPICGKEFEETSNQRWNKAAGRARDSYCGRSCASKAKRKQTRPGRPAGGQIALESPSPTKSDRDTTEPERRKCSRPGCENEVVMNAQRLNKQRAGSTHFYCSLECRGHAEKRPSSQQASPFATRKPLPASSSPKDPAGAHQQLFLNNNSGISPIPAARPGVGTCQKCGGNVWQVAQKPAQCGHQPYVKVCKQCGHERIMP